VTHFASTPDVSFVVHATSGFLQRIQAAPANTFPGTQGVASIIGGLAAQAGFAFRDHGVVAKIDGQYLAGTIIDQIERVALATQTIVLLDQNVLHIRPNGTGRDVAHARWGVVRRAQSLPVGVSGCQPQLAPRLRLLPASGRGRSPANATVTAASSSNCSRACACAPRISRKSSR
jgi:hypothetical protein